MTCEEAQGLLVDIVYGEDVTMEDSVGFFRHLDGCYECGREHRELIDARGLLATWQLEDAAMPPPGKVPARRRFAWDWGLLQKAAAVFLIAMGAISILRATGLWPDNRVVVSETALAEMVQDMILAGQEDNWRVIGRALLEAKEDMEMRNRVQMELVGEEVQGLELRFVDALEETNRQMQTLVSSQE